MSLGFPNSIVVIVALAVLSSAACGQAPSAGAGEGAASGEWPSRTPDGQPDMQGLWASDTGRASLNMEPLDYLRSIGMPRRQGPGPGGGTGLGPPPAANTGSGPARQRGTLLLDPSDHILPYHPWAKERRDAVMKDYLHPTPEQIDPQTRGWPNGVPRANYYSSHDGGVGGPIQILQPPGHVVFIYETHHEFRIVPLDGRPHVGQDIKLWMGDSRGRWEGNTLVIDVTNNNASTRFNVVGDFHSDGMRVTERWTFVDRDTIDYKATIDDPKVYTRPWTIGVTHTRSFPGNEIFEYAAVEGDRGVQEAEEILRSYTVEDQGVL